MLEVADDGRGGADVAGAGLSGLRRRVEAIDGTLVVVSEPGRRNDAARGAAVRVLIAEDLALLRDGLTRLLRDNGFDVVDAVADGDALIHAARREQPDIAIVDIRLPPTFRDEGLRAALELRATHAGAGDPRRLAVRRARRTRRSCSPTGGGGIGYLLKDRIMNVDDFVDAVRRVAEGGTALDAEVVAQLFSRGARGARSSI